MAAWPHDCETNRITGQLQVGDPSNVTVTIGLYKNDELLRDKVVDLQPDGSYHTRIPKGTLPDGIYTIKSVATSGDISDEWTYETYIGDSCGMCGNAVVEQGEQCETNDDCGEWLFCGACACLEWREMRELVVSYADEVAWFKHESVAADAVQLPKSFAATGWPFAFVDTLIKKLGVRFAASSQKVYHTVPEWTLDPSIDTKTIWLDAVYASLPPAYQNRQTYFRFKWLFVPIELAGQYATEDQLLDKLNQGVVVAPETPSINTLGAVKILYAHAVSFVDSPFAGIGSYVSVFWEVGDEISIYVKKDQKSYEQRTYKITSKFQIEPDKTSILGEYTKEGLDSFALITCRDGNVLWSTKAREIILADRVADELGDFHKSVVAVWSDKELAEARKKIDAYLAEKDLSEEQVMQLVAKLEEVADEGKGNPLSVIATYGKYMAAYDAVYNDKSIGG